MSNPFVPNPYASPQGMPPQADFGPPVSPGSYKMEYMRAYNYIFENPQWTSSVLWGFLCILSTAIIPVLGQLVFMGYQWEVTESLHRTRGTRYPTFDVNRFADYLGRSIWPFLVNLIVAIPMMFIIMIAYVLGILIVGGLASLGGEDLGPVLAGVGFLIFFICFLGLIMAMTLFIFPFMIRAGLSQDFNQSFNFAWAKSFVSKTWLEMLLMTLFMMITGSMLMFVGVLALCIGMYAAMAVVFLAAAHFNYQLYQLFLSRGGEPIPLKMPTAPQGMMAMPPQGPMPY